MNCDYCLNEATLFLTKIEETGLKKVSVCKECSKDKELMAEEGLLNMLPTSAVDPIIEKIMAIEPEPANVQTCTCGFTSDDLLRVGRLGCPTCYQTFDTVVLERIKNVQRGTKHTGKQIQITLTPEMILRKQESLTDEMQLAIAQEKFEKAALLRDEIDALSQQLSPLT